LQSRSLSNTLPAPAGAGTALYPTTKASGLYPVPQPSLCCKTYQQQVADTATALNFGLKRSLKG
jgi:hypothetical protein